MAQNYRYQPLTQTVKSALDGSDLGAVGPGSRRILPGTALWRLPRRDAHPLIIDMSIHHFDMMRLFLGSDASAISARSWNPPWSWFKGDASAAAQIGFANGVPGQLQRLLVFTSLGDQLERELALECERGVLLVEDDKVFMQQLLSAGDGRGSRANQHGDKRELPLIPMARAGQDYLLHEFCEAVERGTPTGTIAQDNLKTMEFVIAVVEACDSGETITL